MSLPYIISTTVTTAVLLIWVQLSFRKRPLKDLLTFEPKVSLPRIGVGFGVFIVSFLIVFALIKALSLNYFNFQSSSQIHLGGPIIIFLEVGTIWSVLILLLAIIDALVFTMFLQGFILQAFAPSGKSKFIIFMLAALTSLILFLVIDIKYYLISPIAFIDVAAFIVMMLFIAVIGKGLEYAIGVGIAYTVLIGFPSSFGLLDISNDFISDILPLILLYIIISSIIWKLCEAPKHGDHIEDIYD